MPTYFDLKRRFIERTKYDPDELLASEISGKRLGWDKVGRKFVHAAYEEIPTCRRANARDRVAVRGIHDASGCGSSVHGFTNQPCLVDRERQSRC